MVPQGGRVSAGDYRLCPGTSPQALAKTKELDIQQLVASATITARC